MDGSTKKSATKTIRPASMNQTPSGEWSNDPQPGRMQVVAAQVAGHPLDDWGLP